MNTNLVIGHDDDNNERNHDNESNSLFVSALQDVTDDMVEVKLNGDNDTMVQKMAEVDITSTTITNLTKNGHKSSGSSSIHEFDTIPIPSSLSFDNNAVQNRDDDSTKKYIDISITDTKKLGEGMSTYVVYNVETRTNVKQFKNAHMSVLRRFSDFLGLHNKLSEKYLKIGRIIPPAPEKNILGQTKIKFTENNTEQNDFIEKRKIELERFLKRIAVHSVLSVDIDFVEFLESDVELPKAVNTSALSGAGVVRLFNRVGETVNKMTMSIEEKDQWFIDKLLQIDLIDGQYQKMYYSLEALITQRTELSANTQYVAKSIALLSSVEDNAALSKALTLLAEVEEKVEIVHMKQAQTDFYILAELLKDYIGLFGAIREVFHERVKRFKLWDHSQQMLYRCQEMKAKTELSGRQDKVDQADAEVFEWQNKVQRAKENFDKISKIIKSEVEKFELNRVDEFKKAFMQYLKNHIEYQNQIINCWESFIPQTKVII